MLVKLNYKSSLFALVCFAQLWLTRAQLGPIVPPSDASLTYQGGLAPFVTSTSPPTGVPVVTLANGSYYGNIDTAYNVEKFFGMRFAQPVINNNRFRAPQPLNETWNGVRNATNLGPSCPQPIPNSYWTMEDCLNLNVYRPANVSKFAKLPVVVYIYGGGGLSGSNANPNNDYTGIISQGVKIGKPFIGVVANYRMNRNMASSEMLFEEATNLMIRDNRQALLWVHENIGDFGGDPAKVTLAGESYGAILASYQMLMDDGHNHGLFRAAVLSSGGPTANSFGDLGAGQTGFNYVVNATGCYDTADRLQCLRAQNYSTIYKAFLNAPANIFVSPGVPIIDGSTIKRLPHLSLLSGKYSKIPLIIGGCRDEGTGFVTTAANDTAGLQAHWSLPAGPLGLGGFLFPRPVLIPSTVTKLLQLYSDVPSLGAPFNGLNFTPPISYGLEWRRSAAIAGDIGLEQSKRFMGMIFSQNVPVYTYQWGTPSYSVANQGLSDLLGVAHGSDVPFIFISTRTSTDFGNWTNYIDQAVRFGSSLASFYTDLTPNNHGLLNVPYWPLYNLTSGKLMTYWNATKTTAPNISIIADTARQANLEYIWSINTELRV